MRPAHLAFRNIGPWNCRPLLRMNILRSWVEVDLHVHGSRGSWSAA